MTSHIVIGTAGHVDHGKTALVRALTGTETDRWEEEKRRGITIDIGFAELALPSGRQASIVDVPGHEDFIRNMVAGATGVDVALLVIAADEGIMPQTEEHLAILEFLGVRVGVVAVTKMDLAEEEWLDLVLEEVRERLNGTAVEWTDIVPVSSTAGTGLEVLRTRLDEAAAHARVRNDLDLFRLPVDRVFTVAGTGTVVTGTTWSGTAAVGDDVVVLPGELRSRVRAIQAHGHASPQAVPGRRTAVALTNIERAAVSRGSWVVHDAGWRETRVLDVAVTLLPEAPAMSQRTRVRMHLGTAEVMGRVTPATDRIASGQSGTVRLRLEAPVVARWGDRVVLRSYSPVTTIGGGVVADPWPASRPRRPLPVDDLLGDPGPRLAALLERGPARGVARDELPVRLGIGAKDIDRAIEEAGAGRVISVGVRLVSADTLVRARKTLIDTLTSFHQHDPLVPGMSRQVLRKRIGDVAVADHVERELAQDGSIVVERASVRLAEHTARLGPDLEATAAGIRNALADAGFEGCTVPDLAERCGTPEATALRVVEFLVRENTAARVGRDRYYDRAALQRMVAAATQEVLRRGEVSPAQLRESLGLTRKYLIPFLEWLDGEGFTIRVGNVRRPGPRLTNTSADP